MRTAYLPYARLRPSLPLSEPLHSRPGSIRTGRALLPDIDIARSEGESLLGIEAAADEREETALDGKEEFMGVGRGAHARLDTCGRLDLACCGARCHCRHSFVVIFNEFSTRKI